MRAQRPASAALCLAATADSLPFADQSFDAAMAVLSDHHWPDPIAGLREMRRVGRRGGVVYFCAEDAREVLLAPDSPPGRPHASSEPPPQAPGRRAGGAPGAPQ